jgi:Ras GTPase-activating-like protein IQGAP2/3
VFSAKDSPNVPSPAKRALGLGYRAPTAPPKGSVSALASRFANPTEDGTPPPARGRIPSLSTDRRQLGKHLPRIVSGDAGWDGDARKASGKGPRDRKVSVSKPPAEDSLAENVPPAKEEPSTPAKARSSPAQSPAWRREQPSTPTRQSPAAPRIAPLTPSHTVNRETPGRISSSATATWTPKSSLLGSMTAPRAEVHGEEMKDLMSVISAAPARRANTDGVAGVAGMNSRLRLSQTQRLPLAASSATLAPAPLPSRRLQNNWMDRQRHALAAYEYLCHVGEAQQWIEGCLDEELEFGVTEMEEGLRDGVVLAKLSRCFQGEQVVRRIWTEAKHRYRQSDNINYFLNFVRQVGMPETFIFELTDLYNKKNIPKVIFCIHVLSHLLARLGRAERMNNLLGQFEFTDEQLAATQKGIQGVAMPNFAQVGQTLAKEANFEPEPEEEVETEDESELKCSVVTTDTSSRPPASRVRGLDLGSPAAPARYACAPACLAH